MRVTTRRAEFADVPWLVEQARQFEDPPRYKRRLFTTGAVVGKAFAELISHHVVLIATDGAERRGFIVGVKTPNYFNPAIRCLVLLLWWVPREYRDGRAGTVLLREFERIGRAEADWVTISVTTGTLARDNHMTRRGFRLAEKLFLLEV